MDGWKRFKYATLDAYVFLKTKKKKKQSPFSKIFEYVWTGLRTRISASTIAFAHYTHTHVSYLNRVNICQGNICQERRSHLALVPFSFPRTFRRIFLTLLDNVTLLVESLRQVVNFQVSLSADVWTKNIPNITVWLPGVHVNLSVKCCGVFQFGIMYKALSTRIRTFLEPHIFYQDSCGRSLKPLWRAVSKQCARFWFPNSLVSCKRKADSLKKVCGLKNIRIRVDVAKQKENILR